MPEISIDRMGEIMKTILTGLKDLGGEARVKDLLDRAEGKLDLTDYEKETLERSGYVRWHTNVRFYSIDCVKAGYIQKPGGKWTLTKQGGQALNKPAGEFSSAGPTCTRASASILPPCDLRQSTAPDAAIFRAGKRQGSTK